MESTVAFGASQLNELMLPREFDALAGVNIKRLHAVLRSKELLHQQPQLWRAVCLEDLVFQHVNKAAGFKRHHNFARHHPALVTQYAALAADLVAHLDKQRDDAFWHELNKRRRPSKMKGVFRDFLKDKGLSPHPHSP